MHILYYITYICGVIIILLLLLLGATTSIKLYLASKLYYLLSHDIAFSLEQLLKYANSTLPYYSSFFAPIFVA